MRGGPRLPGGTVSPSCGKGGGETEKRESRIRDGRRGPRAQTARDQKDQGQHGEDAGKVQE